MQPENSQLENFSSRLSLAMARAGIRRGDFADKAGVSRGYISDLLNGKKNTPPADTVKSFSEILQCSHIWLLLGERGEEKPAIMDEGNPYIPRDISPGPAPPSTLSAADLSNHIDLLIAELRPLFQALPTATVSFRAVIRSRIDARIDEFAACACS